MRELTDHKICALKDTYLQSAGSINRAILSPMPHGSIQVQVCRQAFCCGRIFTFRIAISRSLAMRWLVFCSVLAVQGRVVGIGIRQFERRLDFTFEEKSESERDLALTHSTARRRSADFGPLVFFIVAV